MSSSDTTRTVAPSTIDSLKTRNQAIADVMAGTLATNQQLMAGIGFTSGDYKSCMRLWSTDQALRSDISDELRSKLTHLSKTLTPAAISAVRDAAGGDEEVLLRCDFYLSAAGDAPARNRVIIALLQASLWQDCYQIAFAVGIASAGYLDVRKPQFLINRGRRLIDSTHNAFADSDAAQKLIDDDNEASAASDAALDELFSLVLEDRADIAKTDDVTPADPAPTGRIVVPELPAGATAARREIVKCWDGIAGVNLPAIHVDDLTGPLAQLQAEYPHAADIAMRMAMHLQPGKPFKLPPILLVGEPGCGKTSFLRSFADAFSVPVETHGFAGASDASLMGTSAQWATARESAFLQQVKRARISNPVAILDEIEKASLSRHNGSILEGVLPLLESHTASRFRDPCLEVEVDLSGLSVLATANSLDGIPAPLRDRFTIMRMPNPEFQHIGVLSRRILDRIARERGLDPRWFPSLGGDEIEAMRSVWDGGSLRRLERALRLLVDSRDRLLPCA